MTKRSFYADLLTGLVERKWGVNREFLLPDEIRALREDAAAREARGEFAAAGIGRAAGRIERTEVRGDHTCWWKEEDLSPAQKIFYGRLLGYREVLNRELFLGLRRVEAHYAYYPPGTHYQRHLDTFRNTNERLVSFVLYLNDEWSAEDGGELVLYPEGAEPVRIAPHAGLLATFLSESMPHEVLSNRRGRWSVTGWLGKDTGTRW